MESNESGNPEETKQDGTVNDEILEPGAKIADLEAKLAEANDRFVRLYSEFDNYKKRTLKERIELIKSAGEDIFQLILPSLDDLERAIKANEEAKDVKAVNDGVKLIQQKLYTTLTSRGLEEMKTIGEEFNADLHEAITNIPAPSEDMKGKIVEVMEKGYTLNGKVIRFAKVIVGA